MLLLSFNFYISFLSDWFTVIIIYLSLPLRLFFSGIFFFFSDDGLFFSALRKLFNTSCKASLVVVIFSFCLLGKLLISSSALNDNLAGYSILGYSFLPFSTLNISRHSLLPMKLLLRNQPIALWDSLACICYFFLAPLRLSLYLNICHFNYNMS